MTYVCDLGTGQQIYLDNLGDQTTILSVMSGPGQQQQSSSSFSTGTWTHPPQLFRTAGGLFIKLMTAQGETVVQIQGQNLQTIQQVPDSQHAQQLQVSQVNEMPGMTMQPMKPMQSMTPMQPLNKQPMKMGDMQMSLNPMQMQMGNMQMKMGEDTPVSKATPSKERAAQRQFCTQCGQAADLSDRFCGSCGHPLSQ